MVPVEQGIKRKPNAAPGRPQLRDKEKRDERRVARQEERHSLKADYLTYMNRQLSECQEITRRAIARRQELLAESFAPVMSQPVRSTRLRRPNLQQ